MNFHSKTLPVVCVVSFCRFVNLSEDIAENFKCSVCLDIFEAPLELHCGHIYCLECIRDHFNGRRTSECPECRARVDTRDVKPPNRKLLCLLHNLNIKCEFRGCKAIVKVENLIAHTRECRFNGRIRASAPPSESNQRNTGNVTDFLDGDSNPTDRLERLHRFQAYLHAYLQAIEEIEDDDNEILHNEGSRGSSNEFLMYGETFTERLSRWIDHFVSALIVTLNVFFAAVPIAAIVISALKLHSCTQMPTLPHALMALGISMFLSVILETTRSCYYKEKLCVGLIFIQSFAFGSLIYLAVVVYTNLDYTMANINSTQPNALTCDGLLFEFSFWFVSALLAFISFVAIAVLVCLVYNNLENIWLVWSGSFIQFLFIYSIAIIGIIISISSITMGSIYFDSCDAIPSLTTELVVFGCIGSICWLTMLLCSDYRDCCVWLFIVSSLISFICVAVSVHANFPWEISSHALRYTINCNATIYIYSFVIVCINYVIIGAAILMYFIYAGICACLFFR